MLRRLSTAALVALATLATSAQAHHPGRDGGRVAARDAWVKVSSCSLGDRSATFHARMRRLAPGQRLGMRLTLLELDENGKYAPVEAPGLRRWRKSKTGVKAFAFRQHVRALTPGSSYRARVEFRWYALNGRVTRRERRRSGVCNQSERLPNLRVRVVGSAPTELPGVRRYRVRVANVGRAPAFNAPVRLAVDGAAPAVKRVPRIGAGRVAYVHFSAAQCTSSVRAEADPEDEIAESSEADNFHEAACAALARR